MSSRARPSVSLLALIHRKIWLRTARHAVRSARIDYQRAKTYELQDNLGPWGFRSRYLRQSAFSWILLALNAREHARESNASRLRLPDTR